MEEHDEAKQRAALEAAARREARMKRILENSNSRLGKVTGKEINPEGKLNLFFVSY